jgi:hypothetical protein
MRNAEPSLVVERGFVELPALLSGALCGALSDVSMDKAHAISNARELDCHSLKEWAAVKCDVEDNAVVREAMRCAFGVAKFCLDEAKLLEAPANGPPQIPHADAINNAGGMFGVVQLRDGQAPTEALEYAGVDDLFVEEETECVECNCPIRLTDKQARQREHLRRLSDLGAVPPWTCARAGRGECGRRRKKSRRQEAERTGDFLGDRVCNAFRSLLDDPVRVIELMQPCGEPEPAMGDALLALPTLLHRGPGGGGGTVARRVLFFFVRPVFAPTLFVEGGAFRYDSSSQVHAAYLLDLAAKCASPGFLDAAEAEAVRERYENLHPRNMYNLRKFQPTRGLRGAGVG